MAFEIFKQVGVSSKLFISIGAGKAFGLPRPFLDRYGITNGHKAVILYDAESKAIALHFTSDEVKYGLKVQIANAKHGALINAKSFFELKGIDATKYAGRYEDFKQVPMADLGIPAPGSAFVIHLKDRADKQVSEAAEVSAM
jgi:hypothetical protein